MLFWFQSVVSKVWLVWNDFTSSNDPFAFIHLIHKDFVWILKLVGIKVRIFWEGHKSWKKSST